MAELKEDPTCNSENLIDRLAEGSGVSGDDLRSKTKVRRVVAYKMIGMVYLREMADMSTLEVGKLFGGRDHTTVLYAERIVGEYIDKKFDDQENLEIDGKRNERK